MNGELTPASNVFWWRAAHHGPFQQVSFFLSHDVDTAHVPHCLDSYTWFSFVLLHSEALVCLGVNFIPNAEMDIKGVVAEI